MSKLFSNYPLYFSPDTPVATGGLPPISTVKKDLSVEDAIEFLSTDDEKEVIELDDKKKPVKKEEKEGEESEKEEKEEEPEEIDELKELEKELEEPSEENLELVTPIPRREILKKYPTLFKDFPYLEKAYYRDQQFTQFFPTPEDARRAVQSTQTLENFEHDILSGNTEKLLKAVKEENPQGFYKLVDNYMVHLANVDDKAYFHVVSNIGKQTIMAMVREAKTSNNQVLQDAAQILNQFLFGSSTWNPPTTLAPPEKPEDKQKENEISQRERQIFNQQLNFHVSNLNSRVNNSIRNTIDGNIDPNESMTDYVRGTAAREAFEDLQRLIEKDAGFIALKDKLWEKAINEGMTEEAVDKIRRAYVSKAKTLLPSVLKKARNNAYRGMGRRVSEENTDRKGPIVSGKPRSQESRPSGKIKEAKDIPRGMNTLEFLNQD